MVWPYVERCSDDSMVKKYKDIILKVRPRKTWYQVVDSDLRSLKIDFDLVQN